MWKHSHIHRCRENTNDQLVFRVYIMVICSLINICSIMNFFNLGKWSVCLVFVDLLLWSVQVSNSPSIEFCGVQMRPPLFVPCYSRENRVSHWRSKDLLSTAKAFSTRGCLRSDWPKYSRNYLLWEQQFLSPVGCLILEVGVQGC